MQEAMLILAEASMVVGDHATALDSFRELLATRLELLGADHHETIAAAWNLVDAYQQTGNPDAAKALRQRYMTPLLAADPATLSEPLARLAEAMHEGRRPGKLE
jgi:non-specific serine/threonine protein kinase/serine/threonine-protein kinase